MLSPAVPAHATGSAPVPVTGAEPRPEAVVTELDRIVRRWRELPLDRAQAVEPLVRSVICDLLPPGFPPPPDLGPAVVIDQLRVVVFDACRRDGDACRRDGAACRPGGDARSPGRREPAGDLPPGWAAGIVDVLGALRRSIG